MSRAVEKGVHAARAPFGLRQVYQGREVGWEKDPVEAPVVRELYRLAVEENRGYWWGGVGANDSMRVLRDLVPPNAAPAPSKKAIMLPSGPSEADYQR